MPPATKDTIKEIETKLEQETLRYVADRYEINSESEIQKRIDRNVKMAKMTCENFEGQENIEDLCFDMFGLKKDEKPQVENGEFAQYFNVNTQETIVKNSQTPEIKGALSQGIKFGN